MQAQWPLPELWQEWLGKVPPPATSRYLDKWLKPKLWTDIGWATPWLWGQVRTKGSLVYRVLLHKPTKSSQCSCSASIQPCVHVLALLHGWQSQALVARADQPLPDWIPEKITPPPEKRPPPASKKPASLIPPARVLEMEAGYTFLKAWLYDQSQIGWKSVLETGPDTLDETAARLVDHRLPGPARLIRELATPPPWGSSADHVRRTLSRLFLATRGFSHRAQLSEEEWLHLMVFTGVTIRKDTLKKTPPVVDQWQILHLQEEEAEADLRSRRTWLYGPNSGRFALLLDFAWKKAPLPPPLVAGGGWNGECYFYPGSGQHRVILGEGQHAALQSAVLPAHSTWNEAKDELALQQSLAPLQREHPMMIKGTRIRRTGQMTALIDRDGQSYPIVLSDSGFRELLVRETSDGLHLFGVFLDGFFHPLTVIEGDRFTALPRN